jgi:hypothetical protein
VDEVTWTRERQLVGQGYYAAAAGAKPADFRSEVQRLLDGRAAAFARAIDRLEADAAALVQRVTAERSRAASAALLPPEGVTERVIKYERHLNSLLTTTLHELERMQDRRIGAAVLPPLVADIQITASPGLD